MSRITFVNQHLPSLHSVSLSKPQAIKVASVALACLAMFSLQLQCSFILASKISFVCSTATFLSEKLKNNSADWFTAINTKELLPDLIKRLLLFPICTGLLYTSLGLPVQVVAQKILFCDLRVIFIATVIAPVVEEILFRGFIQERIEDVSFLVGRYIHQIPVGTTEKIALATQAVFFGLSHLPGNQIIGSLFDKVIVFSTVTFSGYYYGMAKNKDQSLLPSIALHALQNITLTLGLLAFKPLIINSLFSRSIHNV